MQELLLLSTRQMRSGPGTLSKRTKQRGKNKATGENKPTRERTRDNFYGNIRIKQRDWNKGAW
jgi:hypothetical protein